MKNGVFFSISVLISLTAFLFSCSKENENSGEKSNVNKKQSTSKIAFESTRGGSYDIWIMDRFGRDRKNLTHRPAFDSCPVVTKDGKTIFFLSDSAGGMQIWSMDISGMSLKQITNDRYDKQDISIYAP